MQWKFSPRTDAFEVYSFKPNKFLMTSCYRTDYSKSSYVKLHI